MSRFLITGFEPFTTGQGLTLTHNPTSVWAREIAERLEDAVHATLPVSFVDTKASLQKRFDQEKPAVWLGLGYAPHRERVDVEFVALNLEHSESGDNDGAQPRFCPIIPDAPTALTTRFPVDEVVAQFQSEGVDAQVAFHAGTFLCNQTFYLGCYEVEVNRTISVAAFIHVPPSTNGDTFVRAVVTILNGIADGLSL